MIGRALLCPLTDCSWGTSLWVISDHVHPHYAGVQSRIYKSLHWGGGGADLDPELQPGGMWTFKSIFVKGHFPRCYVKCWGHHTVSLKITDCSHLSKLPEPDRFQTLTKGPGWQAILEGTDLKEALHLLGIAAPLAGGGQSAWMWHSYYLWKRFDASLEKNCVQKPGRDFLMAFWLKEQTT